MIQEINGPDKKLMDTINYVNIFPKHLHIE